MEVSFHIIKFLSSINWLIVSGSEQWGKAEV